MDNSGNLFFRVLVNTRYMFSSSCAKQSAEARRSELTQAFSGKHGVQASCAQYYPCPSWEAHVCHHRCITGASADEHFQGYRSGGNIQRFGNCIRAFWQRLIEDS